MPVKVAREGDTGESGPVRPTTSIFHSKIWRIFIVHASTTVKTSTGFRSQRTWSRDGSRERSVLVIACERYKRRSASGSANCARAGSRGAHACHGRAHMHNVHIININSHMHVYACVPCACMHNMVCFEIHEFIQRNSKHHLQAEKSKIDFHRNHFHFTFSKLQLHHALSLSDLCVTIS